MDASNAGLVKHTGGCHCGKVAFECWTESSEIEVEDCNCSICSKKAYLHLIVPKSRFNWIGNRDDASLYQFGTNSARHYFCKTCGIAPFYVPRSNPDGWDINARCLDEGTVTSMKINPFDGKGSWDSEAERLAHLSKEGDE